MNIQDRFLEIRKVLKLSQKDFAKSLNSSQPKISRCEKGEAPICSDLMYLLYANFNINIYWLLSGDGDMFVNEKSTNNKQTISGDNNTQTLGNNNSISNNYNSTKNPYLNEVIKIIEDGYVPPKVIKDFRDKLLKYKELFNE